MARRSRHDRRAIADAWRRAKADDPSLTQRQFAADAFPAYVDRGGKRRFRSVETRARDLRRILSGKDTRARARSIEDQSTDFMRAARDQRAVNVEVRDSQGRITGYGNILLEPGMTTFDVYRLRNTPEGRRLARQIARKVRRNSPPHDVTEFEDPITGRRILSRVVSPDAGSPAGEQHIGAVRQLRPGVGRQFVGRFGPGDRASRRNPEP